MVKELTKEQLAKLELDEMRFYNACGRAFPSEWIDLSKVNIDFFKSLGLPISQIESSIVYKKEIKDFKKYSFLINEEEGGIYLEGLDNVSELNFFGEISENQDSAVKDVLIEYAVRKFLHEFTKSCLAIDIDKVEFVGLDNTPDENTIHHSIQIKFNNLDLSIFITLPQDLFSLILKENKKFPNFIAEIFHQAQGSEVQLRYDIISFYVPTHSLVEIIKGGEVVSLPYEADFNKVYIEYDGEVKAGGSLKVVEGEIVCKIDSEKDKYEQLLKTSEYPQSLLTCSLGYFSYSLEKLKLMPSILQLEESGFPRVLLIVGDEVIARGKLGFSESSNLCVEVIQS